MPLVSDSLPNLIGGISQQAPALRIKNSAKDLVNADPSVVDGLEKRPPSVHVKQIYNTDPGDMAVEVFNRIGRGTNIITVTDGDLKVFDASGTEETVTFPDGKGYLSAANPKSNFKLLVIADTVFVLNTTVTPTVSAVAETSDRLDPDTHASIYIKQAVPNKNYSVYINNALEANFLTNNSTVEGSDVIATNLSTALGVSGFTSSVVSSTVTISGLVAADEVRHKDGFGDKGSRGIKSSIGDFSDLPPNDLQGRLIRVQGDVEESGDDYYVIREDELWVETYGYNAGETIDPNTMPHILVDNGDGTWTFKETTWGSRRAGDADSNPTPTFVGNTIQSMFVYKNRMVLLTAENVMMSEVGEYENFYRTSLVQLLDSDPIDVASTNVRVSNMYHGVPFNENILLFSDKAQFKLTDQTLLSPKDVQLVISSQFNASVTCSPILVGPNVFFADDADSYTFAAVREYFITENADTGDSSDVTIQVPKYIPAGITKMTSSTTEDIVALFTSGDTQSIYIYKFHEGNQGKVQSSWNKWQFTSDTEFYSGEFLDNVLYVVYKKTDGVFLDTIDIRENLTSQFDDVTIMLDRRTTQTVATNTLVGTDTVVTLPYEIQAGEELRLVTGEGGAGEAGIVYIPTSTASNTATFSGDLTGENYFVGVQYRFAYTLNPIYLYEGEQVIQDGRLQMRYMSFLFNDTAYFTVEFTDSNGTTHSSTFTGRNFGSSNNILGVVSTEDGEFRVATPGENTKITVVLANDSPFPSKFTTVEWEAMYYPKTKRV